jgi:hypothetical protein
MARTIQSLNNHQFTNELIIESVRAKKFPAKTSRLSGLFFLRDLDSAKDCLNWGGHFEIENLCEIYYSTNGSITRCDSNWITNAIVNSRGVNDNRKLTTCDHRKLTTPNLSKKGCWVPPQCGCFRRASRKQ